MKRALCKVARARSFPSISLTFARSRTICFARWPLGITIASRFSLYLYIGRAVIMSCELDTRVLGNKESPMALVLLKRRCTCLLWLERGLRLCVLGRFVGLVQYFRAKFCRFWYGWCENVKPNLRCFAFDEHRRRTTLSRAFVRVSIAKGINILMSNNDQLSYNEDATVGIYILACNLQSCFVLLKYFRLL